MDKISNCQIDNQKVTFTIGKKNFTRTVKSFGKLSTFKYDSKLYYIREKSAYPMNDKMVAIFNEYKCYNHWSMYEYFIDSIIQEYTSSNIADSTVPGGSNTATMVNVHKGNLEKCLGQTYGITQYSSGRYFHKGLKIGTNFPKSSEVFEQAFIVSSLFSNGSCGYNNSNSKASMNIVYGSAFTAIGLG